MLPVTTDVQSASLIGPLILWRTDGLLIAFPVVAYGFTAHQFLFNIYGTLRVPSVKRMVGVVQHVRRTAANLCSCHWRRVALIPVQNMHGRFYVCVLQKHVSTHQTSAAGISALYSRVPHCRCLRIRRIQSQVIRFHAGQLKNHMSIWQHLIVTRPCQCTSCHSLSRYRFDAERVSPERMHNKVVLLPHRHAVPRAGRPVTCCATSEDLPSAASGDCLSVCSRYYYFSRHTGPCLFLLGILPRLSRCVAGKWQVGYGLSILGAVPLIMENFHDALLPVRPQPACT